MTYPRKCQNCKKELTIKYWVIVGFSNGYKASRGNFCFACCDKQSKKRGTKDMIETGEAKIEERETGDQI